MRSFLSTSILAFGAFLILMTLNNCGDEQNPASPGKSVPWVTTYDIRDIALTSASCMGFIVDDRKDSIISYGICWNTSPGPTISHYFAEGIDEFIGYKCTLTNLKPETVYFIRAYATSTSGTGYGEELTLTTNGTVTDIDGNVYTTVKIGNQWWMKENLKVTHDRNGDPIAHITDSSEWVNDTLGAYCIYDNSESNDSIYGLLYNGYACYWDRDIAPEGWHIPSHQDWIELEVYLHMDYESANSASGFRGTGQGGDLKETGTAHWQSPNKGADNLTGFTALPGGFRHKDGRYFSLHEIAFFWTSTTSYWRDQAYIRVLAYDYSQIALMVDESNYGNSVRCVKD